MFSRLSLVLLWLFLGSTQFANAGPLQDAAKAGDVEQIKQLLAQGADINQSTGLATALYYAIQEDHTEAAILLIERGADVNAPSMWGTPLHAGAAEGLTEVVRLLLEHGADPNARINLETPLHLAAKNGHIEVVRLLLDHGADVNAVAGFDAPALHSAIMNGHTKTFAVIRCIGIRANPGLCFLALRLRTRLMPTVISAPNRSTNTRQSTIKRLVSIERAHPTCRTPRQY
jgi:cytochrome c